MESNGADGADSSRKGRASRLRAGCCSCSCLTKFHYWKMMLLFGGVNFIDAMIYSIPSTFYPKEAEQKGLTSSEYGFVFGIYELTEFIASPLVANYMYKTTPRCLFHTGVLVTGSSVVLFGFLDSINDHTTFFLLSILLRIIEAASSGLLIVAAYTIVTDRQPESATQTIAFMELLFGVGFSTGPIVGEALYLLGGFQLPFVALGGVFLVCGVLVSTFFCFDVPPEERTKAVESVEQEGGESGGMLTLLRLPVVLLQCFAIVVGNICFSFLLAVLEPHLREFDLQPMGIGMAFFLNGAFYAVFMPVFAKVTECVRRTEYLELVGAILELVAVALVGPAPFLQLTPAVKWVMVGLILNGISLAAIYISSFVITLDEAKAAGCRDPHALVSALWMSCMTLGSFIGPSVAGVLVDKFGFPRATYFLQGLSVALIALVLGRVMKSKCMHGARVRMAPAPAEETPLLTLAFTKQ